MTLDPYFEDHSQGNFAAKSILSDPEFTKSVKELGSLSRWDGQFFEALHPYALYGF